MSKVLRHNKLNQVEAAKKIAEEGFERTVLSFYKYVRIKDPERIRNLLFEEWEGLSVLGRVYVAKEGINAQMNVPKEHWGTFDAWIQNQPKLAGIPYKIAVEEGELPSFFKLTVKVKDKIVADGLDDASFDVTNTGDYLTAAEMNDYVNDPDAVVVDMRNNYESEVGHFETALTPDVVTFRDELKKTPELLKIHQNKKIALYCTGGIRCEKASAYLKHKGFKDVYHLEGGIIKYARDAKEKGLRNKFIGKNFVFDERLNERITEDVIAECHQCGESFDDHTNCKNKACNLLFIQCPKCAEKYAGTCSEECKTIAALPIEEQRELRKGKDTGVRIFSKGRFMNGKLTSK